MDSRYMAECPNILREYLGYMETVKGRSNNTVNGYFIDLRTFFRYYLMQKQELKLMRKIVKRLI